MTSLSAAVVEPSSIAIVPSLLGQGHVSGADVTFPSVRSARRTWRRCSLNHCNWTALHQWEKSMGQIHSSQRWNRKLPNWNPPPQFETPKASKLLNLHRSWWPDLYHQYCPHYLLQPVTGEGRPGSKWQNYTELLGYYQDKIDL